MVQYQINYNKGISGGKVLISRPRKPDLECVMPLQILKKIKALFKGKSSKEAPDKDAVRKDGAAAKQGRRDGFSSRRERDQKRREHSEMADSTNKVMSRGRRGEAGKQGTGSKGRPAKPSNRQLAKPNRDQETGGGEPEAIDATKSRRKRAGDSAEPRRDRAGRGHDRGHNRAERPARESHGPAAEIDYEAIQADNGDWTVDQFKVEPAEGKRRFHDFDIPVEIMHAIFDLGFQYCTPIQAGSLEQAMAGANVAGRAQTGTGKTAAYLVAILTRYLRTPDKRQEKSATPRALVIAPTRELCVQICRDAQALGKYCGLRSLAVFGGMDYGKQSAALAQGTVDLLAATPGRLLDFQRQHIVDLSKIDTLVIDEADRMLDMGFIPDVRRIIRSLPRERQTLLYSATLDDEVMRLAAQWMPDPVKVEIEPEKTANQSIEQKVFIVTSDQKFTILCHLLDQYAGQRVLIFGNRRVSTDHLAEKLRRQGYPCELLSGEVSQSHRMAVLDRFRDGSVKIVVATDVAGRGLHIADIGLVVNFELPYEAEDYVHRIGRTGRAGKVGTSVSFADEDESFIIPDIEQYIGEELKCTNPDESLLAPLPPPQRRQRRAKRDDGPENRDSPESQENLESQDGQPPAPSKVEPPAAEGLERPEVQENQEREPPAAAGEAEPPVAEKPESPDRSAADESEQPPAEEDASGEVAGDVPAHRRRRHHHRRGHGGKKDGESEKVTAESESVASAPPAAPAAPAAPPPPSPQAPAAPSARIPRAVIVPKGVTEQVWVPGQN